MKRHLLNLALATLVGILVLAVIFEPGIEAPTEPVRLTKLQESDIHRIRLDRHDRESVVIERHDDKWRMIKPITILAGQYRVDQLARIASTISLSHYPLNRIKPEEIDLEPPQVTLTYNDDIALAFGGRAELDNRRYVRIGDTLHLIPDTSFYQLASAYTNFIDNRLFDDDTRFNRFELPQQQLAKVEGIWQVTTTSEQFSADSINALVDAWRYASATEIRDYDGKEEGEKITITLVDDTQVKLLVTARTPDLVLARPDLSIQYHLPEHLAIELLQIKTVAENTTVVDG